MVDYKYPLHPYHKITDLKDMMEISVRDHPDHNAFLTKPVIGEPYYPVNYQQYYDDIDALGTQLVEMGVDKDSRIAIVAETRYEWYVSYLAIMNGDPIVVPIDKELPEGEMLNLFNRSRCTAIIYSQRFAPKVEEVAARVPTLKHLIRMNDVSFAVGKTTEDDPAQAFDGPDEFTLETGEKVPVHGWNDLLRAGRELAAAGDRRFRDIKIEPDAVRVLLFTSGTTSASKCVMHSHNTICANIMDMGRMLFIGLNNDDVLLSVLPLNHTYECTCGFLYQIYKGDTIAQVEGLRYITDNMKEAKVTCILCVPLLLEAVHRTIWKSIRKQGKEKLVRRMMGIARRLKFSRNLRKKIFKSIHEAFGGQMQTFIAGGAAIDPQILQDFNEWGFVAIQGYGLTEFAPIMALNRENLYRNDSAGLPLPHAELKIVEKDENGIGEICGRGPNMMLGYYEDPELTAASIIDGWYHTGDMGYLTDDGFVIITGRKKNLIVTKSGKNIYPEELEAILNRNAEISESVVSNEKSDSGDDLITVEIFPDKEAVEERLGKKDPSAEEVLDLMKKLVSEFNEHTVAYQHIRSVKIRDKEFLKNTSRKILRDYSKKTE